MLLEILILMLTPFQRYLHYIDENLGMNAPKHSWRAFLHLTLKFKGICAPYPTLKYPKAVLNLPPQITPHRVGIRQSRKRQHIPIDSAAIVVSPCYCRLHSIENFSKTSIAILMEAEGMLQPLRSIVPAAQNNINTKFIVLDKARVTLEGQYKTCLALVADETAAVHFQLWGDECDAVEAGDILVLRNGIFSYSRNNLVLRAGKRGEVVKMGEFTMAFVETPNLSEIRWEADPRAANKYVQQAVISAHSRLFPPPH